MIQTTDTMSVYLNEDRQGAITCLHCGQKHLVNMSNYQEQDIGGKTLKVKCSVCNKTFHVRFDLRRYQRLNVHFPGQLIHLSSQEKISSITVTSLSVGGVSFTLDSEGQLQHGEVYKINFHLDDRSHSLIYEEVIIKHFEGRCAGAEFHQSDAYNYALDFYIISEPSSF